MILTRENRSQFILYMRVAALVVGFLALSAPFRAQDLRQAHNPTAQAQSSSGASQTADNSGNVLWRLAQQCASDLSSDSGCRTYTKNGKQEYVIIQDNDRSKPQGYLLIPVARVTGIEDSQVFAAPFLDLWESAWLWSEKYPGKPPSRTGLAINSVIGRSQNQLHLHISCVLPDVAKTLARTKISANPARPTSLKLGPHQNIYWAVAVPTLEGMNSPFEIVHGIAQANKTHMKDQSVLVVGSQKGDRYYILDTTANGANLGHAEELLDQTCGRE
jgi:CDP-diacylglycerol pyrophosphatase